MVCDQPDACRTSKQIGERPGSVTFHEFSQGSVDERLNHITQTLDKGPSEIRKSFERQTASSAEVKASVDKLAAPFEKFDTEYGTQSSRAFATFQQGIASLGKQPDGGTAALKDFNAVMKQYGVSLEKVGTDYELKSSDGTSTIKFDSSGKVLTATAHGAADSSMPQFTLVGTDERSARVEFGQITMHAYNGAMNQVDKFATSK